MPAAGRGRSSNGVSSMADTAESLSIIRLIKESCATRDLDKQDVEFFLDMLSKSTEYGIRLQVTQRQLDRLRQVRDRLKDKGRL